MSVIRFERPVMQALDLFHAGLEIGVSAAGARKKKIKSLIGLFIAVALWSAPAFAQERQERNEVGLQIGGIETPLRSDEHTSELQSHLNLVCRLLLEKK